SVKFPLAANESMPSAFLICIIGFGVFHIRCTNSGTMSPAISPTRQCSRSSLRCPSLLRLIARPAGHAQGLAALPEPCVPEAHKNPYGGTHDVLGYAGSCLLLDR